jgi:Methyltransferase small domain.
MKYPGEELDNFDKATVWRKYIYFEIKKFISGKVLEVGAGIGSFTNNYMNMIEDITLSEVDKDNFEIIKNKFKNHKIDITRKTTNEINTKFDTIMYLNVLEHIEKDKEEIKTAISRLNSKGHLIILVPAHNRLYSKFDEAVGHFKRYEINFFKNLSLENCKIKKVIYLDAMGYFLYYLNKIFFSEETYPSKLKIFIWDKIFTPLTFILDKLLLNKFGKNILYIVKKL